MIVLADENIHRLIAERLAADGHDVTHMADLAPSIADPDVLALAVGRGALLVTNDKDFGELIFRARATHTGVLLVRLGDMPWTEQAERVSSVIAAHADELKRAFSVVGANRLRVRGAP